MRCSSEMVLFLFLLLSVSRVSCQLLLQKRYIYVPIGREVYIQPNDLSFKNGTFICKVEVINNEPMTQRVGTTIPQVFDCSFDSRTVKYVHHGSPLLWKDSVKFRASLFLEHDTVTEYFELFFIVQNTSYNVIQASRPLVVAEFFGISNSIDASVLNFNYSRREGTTCKIKMSRHFDGRPSHGQVVIGQDNQAVDVIKRRCDEFLQLGLRYEHLKPPSPDIDFISITVEVSDPLVNNGEPTTEWYQIPVRIETGFPNLPPKASFSGMYLMDVDQFIITAITPTVLSATDSETPSSALVFNISKPLLPHQGSIVHLSDHSRPISSFKQSDLNRFDIAYKPPARSFKDRQMFEIGFIISDPDFASSDPFTMHIAVRPAVTTAPRVFMNVGLILLEGQSRPLRKSNLEIVDSDNIGGVKVFVTGGLHHGRLEVKNKPAYSFTQDDILSESVVYYHDDSDSVRDSIHLRVSDGLQSSHIKFPIVVIPKDDNSPFLVINSGLKVGGGEDEVPILSTSLRAADHDSPDEDILFNVTRPPMLGRIRKRQAWERGVGEEVAIFSQKDIVRRLIYYCLEEEEVGDDAFEIVLQDPNPNLSPPYTILVQVTAAKNDPPKQDPASSLRLQVREDEMGLFGSHNLHYMDVDSLDEEIMYRITSPPRFIGSLAHEDPGRIVYLSDDESSPVVSFSQQQVNHQKVAYSPPAHEIGPSPLFLQFSFSVTDRNNNSVRGQTFNITVLPVNNQAPQIHTSELLVEEGSSTLVSTNEFSAYDPDTLSSDLQISLFTVPLHGSLRRSDQLLRVGDLLSLDDILTLRLEYIHDGSENFRDLFRVGVTDGLHFVSGDVPVIVHPVDDERPTWTKDISPRTSVDEGGEVTLTSQVLAATDPDTNSSALFFIVTEVPLFGHIALNRNKVHLFAQKNIFNDEVKYVHNKQEVGPHPKEDSFTVIVTDRMFPSSDSHDSLKVTVTILPVNSQPPRLHFKRTILVEEGHRSPITEDNIFATDEDTFPAELLVLIVRPPLYGYLENTRPASGYESSRPKERISAFPLQDVSSRFISFVQSNHSEVEPESDDFEICVTDGIHNSSTILVYVSIILVNDEVPHFYLTNITVRENEKNHVLDNRSIIATDRDYPGDILVLSVKERPKSGSLTYFLRAINNGPLLELSFSELSFENFDKIVYHHDGSETTHDSFMLSVHDGLHSVDRTCFVTVLPVNDEPPLLKRNSGAENVGGEFTLSPAFLLAEDADSSAAQIIYKITRPPVYGSLQMNATNSTWDGSSGFTFSQEDINLNRIRYLHKGHHSSVTRDNFTFYLTDGVFNSTPSVFVFKFADHSRRVIHCLVQHGVETALNTTAFDNIDSDVSLRVIAPPLRGTLILNNNPSLDVSNFTARHVRQGRLSYKHNPSSNFSTDLFSVLANDAVETFYTININISTSELPVLRQVSPLFHRGGETSVISPSHLSASPSDAVYSVHEFPKVGVLVYSRAGEHVLNPANFTQGDIEDGFLSYSSQIREPAVDHFSFQLSNDKQEGFIYGGKTTFGPIPFKIFVNVDPDELVVNIRNLSDPGLVWKSETGFALTASHLQAIHSSATYIRFVVGRNLMNGFLLNTRSLEVITSFTQEEVDDGSVVIVLKKEGLPATKDNFTFWIEVDGTKTKQEYSIYLEWSIVGFLRPEYSVCENEGMWSVSLRRSGRLDSSPTVAIMVKELSATEGVDFISQKETRIQFDPGVTESSWKLVIVRDEVEEPLVEMLELVLSQPRDCLIHNSTTRISILDLSTNSCSHSPPKRRFESANLKKECDEKSRGSSLVDENLNRTYFCDGVNWLDANNGSIRHAEEASNVSTVALTLASSENKTCPEADWQEFGEKCYKWYRSATTWAKAESACEEHSLGSLAEVASQEHNNWLTSIANNRPFWIGQRPGQKTGYSNWRKGASTGGGKHRCVLVRGSGVWIHKNCEANQSFVCETPLL